MRSDRLPVAIIGGGASGTILAAQLARRGVGAFLIDGSGRLARGTAYSTGEDIHLLNVRADAMSAWAGDPGDFSRWFEGRGGDPKGFAPRRLYGEYLGELLRNALATGLIETVAATAISAKREDDGWTVALDDGSSIGASAIVLAAGNQPPEGLAKLESLGSHYIRNPWGPQARAAIAELAAGSGTALIVGTGLTMVDLILSLGSAGHRGRTVAVSRRGQVPRAHAAFDPAPVAIEDVPQGDLIALSHWLRRRSGQFGWRAAVDSLRPHSHALWESMGKTQQRRFLRHGRPWWDSHRHRIAPEIAATVADAVATGGLEIWAGRIDSVDPRGDGGIVHIRRRGHSRPSEVAVTYVFDCTGPLGAMARTRDPLLRSLIDGDMVRTDALGTSVDVDRSSRVVGSEAMWALGPLTKGRFWEIVAVPDIREQAASVAADIAREYGR